MAHYYLDQTVNGEEVRDGEGKVVFQTSMFMPGFTEEERQILEARQARRATARAARPAARGTKTGR